MATAAHTISILFKTTAGAGGAAIAGMNDYSMSFNGDILDTTAFDGGAFRTKMHGLRDFSISMSGDYSSTDAAYGLIKANFLDSSSNNLFCRVSLVPGAGVGNEGFEVQCLCESFEVSAAVDGKVEVSFSLTSISDVSSF
jgi:predicted secreted protein